MTPGKGHVRDDDERFGADDERAAVDGDPLAIARTPGPVPASEVRAGRPGPAVAEAPGRIDHLASGDLIVPTARTAVRQPVSGVLVSVIAALLTLGAGLLALGDADPTEAIPALRTTDRWFWLAAAAAVALAAGAVQFAELTARVAAASVGQSRERTETYTAWLVAATATASALALIATFHNVWVLTIGVALVLISVFVTLVSRDLLDDLTDSAGRLASLMHGVVVHLVAFIGLAMISMNKPPDWLSAGLVALLSGMLILETLQRAEVPAGQRLGYAGVGALVMGQSAIAIDLWLTWNWTGGIALLACFFLLNGLLLTAAQQGDLRPRDLGYYGGLGTVAILLIALLSL